jgi:phage tail sheath gpL-like
MSLKPSTGLRNFLANGGSFKKAFEDAILEIYNGTAPDSPDDAATGTKLCTITLNSGAVTHDTKSTAQVDEIVLAGTWAEADTASIVVNGTTYTYTAPTTPTATIMCNGLVALIQDIDADVDVIAVTGTTEKTIVMRSKFKGEAVTASVAKSSSAGTIVLTNKVANVRINSLHFGDPSDGVISKASENWSGVNLATASAGYWRLVTPSDDADLSTTDYRLQGGCGTSGTEMTMTGTTTLSIGATSTVSTFAIDIKDLSV